MADNYIAQSVSINVVENGFLLSIMSWGMSLTLIARTMMDVKDILDKVTWQTSRPLPEFCGDLSQQPTSSGGYGSSTATLTIRPDTVIAR